jgi:predicted DsbA family dithiol-disulfide isomerase
MPSLNTEHRTYLGFIRLTKALDAYRSTNPDSAAKFTLKLAHYQLYPDFPQEGTDKYEWYKNKKYNGSDERMKMYMRYMGELGKGEGIKFDFEGGPVSNTLHAHRVLHWLQNNKEQGTALKAVQSLYKQYFEQRAHPASYETLERACVDAGLSEEEAKGLVRNEEQGLREVKAAIIEQAGNGVDSVPYVMFEGRKRDFTLIGAKSVEEYVKVLVQVEKECS